MSTRPIPTRLALLAALGAAALACRGGDASPARRTLVDSRSTYDPRSLDPTHANDIPSGRLVADIFDGLTRFTPEAALEPGLAERWELSADGLTYTFHLRRHVTFQDGKPFAAANVVKSFTRALDPATHGIPLFPLLPIAGAHEFNAGTAPAVSGLTAKDDSTVVITLTEPLAVFPKMLAMPVASIVPDSAGADFSEHPVGTGPWQFVEWKHDDYVKLARNAHYFAGPPKAESLEIRVIPEPSTAVAEFESGAVDLLYVPESETQSWLQTDEKKALLQSVPALKLVYAAFNVKRGALSDPRVRQAINYAVDRRTIVDRLLGGRGTLAAGVIPPSLSGADTGRKPYPYDLAKAQALLAQSGHASGLRFDLWTSPDPPFPRLAEAIQGYLAPAGITITIVQRDYSSLREAARNGKADIVLKDWYADYPDAENFLYPLLGGTNLGPGGNVSFYVNPAFDRLMSTARGERNDAARASEYRQADEIAFRDAPMLFMYFYNDLYAVQPWLKGFQAPVIFTGQRWTDVEIAHGAH
jgi:peptide/nickel transport system substrate-binding protein